MLHKAAVLLLALFGLTGALPATSAPAAANPVRTENVEAELTAEQAAVPGRTVWLALTQRIRPGWHTYWLNPGDSGIATEIKWTLPPGWSAGAIVWPAPQRFPIGPLVNFGYAGEVHLLTPVTVPADAVPGQPVTLTAAADWLVCEDICIPESATLSLTLPVAAGPAAPSPQAAALFTAARASLPVDNPFPARFEAGKEQHRLTLALPQAEAGRLAGAFFFPEQWTVASPNAAQTLTMDAEGLHLTFPPGGALPKEDIRGVLVLEETLGDGATARQALQISVPATGGAVTPDGAAPGAAASAAATRPTAAASETAGLGLGLALVFALLGGMVLNLMPCVFPVLSMKALALVRHEAEHARAHGLVYTAGVLVCFAAVAGVLIALRAGGAEIGWGFQLQDPLVVGILAYVMFLLGLSLSGVFSIAGSFMGVGQGLAGREGYSGSFFTGVLATVVATPCTAPFMGAAVGYALLQPWYEALAVFLALGLGMALPFLTLTLSPALLRRLPRPGLWMDRLKQALAFPLYATAAWLVWVLSLQAGPAAVAGVLGGMVLVAFAAWLYGVTRTADTGWRLGASAFGLLALVAAVALVRLPAAGPAQAAAAGTAAAGEGHEPFSEARLAELTGQNKPVFVNLTAAWCITCLVNEKTSLSAAAVKAALAERGITYLKGDWTNRDATITRMLERFGRSGVPLYLLYVPGRAEPVVLPQVLTEGLVLDALAQVPVGAA